MVRPKFDVKTPTLKDLSEDGPIFIEAIVLRHFSISIVLSYCAMISFSLESAVAAYANYNSVLIGQEAAGMGGAYTALHKDASAVSFYNPAAMTRMEGATLSASVNAYQKLDSTFGDEANFSTAPTRINQGFFEPVPSSAGSVVSFGHFAIGFSILQPDFNTFAGEIESTSTTTSFLNTTDQSLWVGLSFAMNLSESTAVGFSSYYTARSYQRSITDQLKSSATDVQATIEDKIFTQNSVVYIMGLYHQIDKNWSTGLSLRLPSIPISGTGTYFRSDIDTTPASLTEISQNDIQSETKIPIKASYGIAYQQPKKFTLSFDLTYYGEESYQDLDLSSAADSITHNTTWNFALGGEYYFRSWLAGRFGLFSNFTSAPEISSVGSTRPLDSIDMFGFSTNWTFHTSDKTQFIIGGYWTGGQGKSVQQIGQSLQAVEKNLQIFTMIVGSSYSF